MATNESGIILLNLIIRHSSARLSPEDRKLLGSVSRRMLTMNFSLSWRVDCLLPPEPLTNSELHLRHVIFGKSYDGSMGSCVPPTVTRLTFGDGFTRSLGNHLRQCIHLTRLTLGDCFDRPVDHLPQTLRRLHLGCLFTQPLDHLPSALTHLTVVGRYNLPVDHLPATLQRLCLGCHFNQAVDHLPAALIHLCIGMSEDGDFHFGRLRKSSLAWRGAVGHFNQPVDHLPFSLSALILGGRFNQPVDHLPLSLTRLMLGGQFNQPVDHLPSTLTHLILGNAESSFQQAVDHLPGGLIDLTLTGNQPIDHLPSTLRQLTLGLGPRPFYPQSLYHLPSSLTRLNVEGTPLYRLAPEQQWVFAGESGSLSLLYRMQLFVFLLQINHWTKKDE